MLPSINPRSTIQPLYQAYLAALAPAFRGKIASDYASRLAVATDNSIYQVIPQAVIFPNDIDDLIHALSIAAIDEFRNVSFSPRGGGTGTNGQSLSAGIIIDCSRNMRSILELNLEECWVRVQPGVVLDQLNRYLLPFGLHFAPEISPSNRATIGGMINTDACGVGSKTLGRTSDHVLEIIAVLSNGTRISTNQSDFNSISALLEKHQALIRERFPNAPRTLSGYNLLKAYQENQLNLTYLLCGSEGTLAITGECKLKLSPIPAYKKIIAIQYRHFDDALRALELKNSNPLIIEAIDEKLLELARLDAIYSKIKEFIDTDGQVIKTGALNIVELVADNVTDLDNQLKQLILDIEAYNALGYRIANDDLEAKHLWELRKKSVGLISKRVVGTRRPIPFIEDTAVHPERLADYIADLTALLDRYQLTYGMYGHVDAGCVHVRPAFDLKLIADEQLLKTLSDEVVLLLQKYQGVMWGEHGIGHRVEYSPEFFGETLYAVVRMIKTAFDPYNQLNPGKIAVPFACDDRLVSVSGPLRAAFDKQVAEPLQNTFSTVMACNGNGACFNYATQETMCPSFKVTHDRIHSPKGRAVLMREWLRQLTNANIKFDAIKPVSFFKKWLNKFDKTDFSHEVYQSLQGCLSCKACATQCPLNVDVPNAKARFLEKYYSRYARSARDYLVAWIERIAQWQSRVLFINTLINLTWIKKITAYLFRLIDLPAATKQYKTISVTHDIDILNNLSAAQKEKAVILLQDAFTTYYEHNIVLDTYHLLNKLGFTVYIMPFFVNGKSLQMTGFLSAFKKRAKSNIAYLNQLAATGVAMIGLDPSVTLTYRDEYAEIGSINYHIMLPQEWLLQKIAFLPKMLLSEKNYYLLSHCSEKAACPEAESQWQRIFQQLGLKLTPLAAGCCGMAGTYGHEVEHLALSTQLFKMDWQDYLNQHHTSIMATGFSCRSQVKRLANKILQHPLSILWAELSLSKQTL